VTTKRKLLLGGSAALLLTLPWWGGYLLRPIACGNAGARLGHKVSAQSAYVGWMKLVMSGVDIEGIGHVDHLAVGPGEIEVDHPVLTMTREDVDRLRGKRQSADTAAAGGGSSGSTLRHLSVTSGELTLTDKSLGLRAHIAKFTCDLHGRAGSATLENLEATQQQVGSGVKVQKVSLLLDGSTLPTVSIEGGEVAIWKDLRLTGINGKVLPTLSISGGYGGVPGKLWEADGTFDLESRRADVNVDAKKFTLDKLAPLLKTSDRLVVLHPEKATVAGRLDISAREGRIGFEGQLKITGLDVGSLALSKQAVRDLSVTAFLAGAMWPAERRIEIENAAIEHAGVQAILTGSLDGSGPRPKLEARLQVPQVPCMRALAAFPRPLVPNIADFKLKGEFAMDISTKIDWNDLASLELGGKVGIDGCKVLEAPKEADAKRLMGAFDRRVEIEPGHELDYAIGPTNPDWTPYSEISPHIVNSLMTTEDNGFFKHRGFIAREFRSALVQNLDRGYFRLGASSISMQMTRNVLLSREKTLARKFQELFLTWYLEQNLPKERIMEIYLNVIEFGPGIYGVGRAMRHYFGHPPKEATPREAAFFSSILPNPKRRYIHYCHGQPNERWEAYLDRIVKKNHERKRLTDEEFQQGMTRPLMFDRKEAMPEKACVDMVKRLSAPPDAETDLMDAFSG
jgi:hypothetical protein